MIESPAACTTNGIAKSAVLPVISINRKTMTSLQHTHTYTLTHITTTTISTTVALTPGVGGGVKVGGGYAAYKIPCKTRGWGIACKSDHMLKCANVHAC